MKTITMDWETYTREMDLTREQEIECFDKGVKASEKRLQPILDYLRDCVSMETPVNLDKTKDLLEKAGEL